ncbi:MAG TPA: inositol monophosphatase family protein [Sphaerochaetaceae bacterium]|nr:inositol monophosphatase family protein [Sphaerochaetaceae bacterium]
MDAYDEREQLIIDMGAYACKAQGDIFRDYKDDGSVLTATDTYINERVARGIAQLFPEADIVTEESLQPFSGEAPVTFILDPIDGTDVYSQGLPGWCISLGILNENRTCVGAMVYAPRWGLSSEEGLFLRQDPGKDLLLNGKPFKPRLTHTKLEQLAMASHAPRHISIKKFDGKIRCYGSNILHMISPLIHPHIQGAISVPCFVWDIAGAHALLELQGMVVQYGDGSPFIYTDKLLREREPFEGIVLSGTKEAVETMNTLFIPE